MNTSLACAERVKTLYTAAPCQARSDEDTLIEIAQMNEDSGEYTEEIADAENQAGGNHPCQRLEEIFEMVRDKLQAKQILQIASQQIVLSGGASQLVGVRELAGKKIRAFSTHRPPRIDRRHGRFHQQLRLQRPSVGLISYISMNYHIYDKVEPTVTATCNNELPPAAMTVLTAKGNVVAAAEFLIATQKHPGSSPGLKAALKTLGIISHNIRNENVMRDPRGGSGVARIHLLRKYL